MTIYTFDKVTELLTELNLESYYHGRREHYFKKLHPMIHEEVYDTTPFLIKPTFTERLFYYANSITSKEQIPTCKWCGKPVEYSIHNRGFNDFCSSNTGCGFKYFNEQHGIQSSSQLPSVKDSYKATCLKKHGVDHASKAPAVRAKISAGKKAGKAKALINLIDNLNLEPLNLTKDAYYAAVRRVTEWSYSNNIDIIDPDRTRSNEFHVDHMVSVCYGFQNNIQPYIIGDITNLRMMDRTSNIQKYCDNAITIYELIELYNEKHGTSESAPLTETIVIPDRQPANDGSLKMTYYVEEAGVCHVCGGEAHYIRKDDGTHQCTSQKKHCPAMKKHYNEIKRVKELQRYHSKKKLKA